MNGEAAREWVEKAEGDWVTASALLPAGDPRTADAIAFHSQQCAEKYLKALITHLGGSAPLIHDLRALLGMCTEALPHLVSIEGDCLLLNPFAVELRYPGHSLTLEEAREALARAKRIRSAVRKALDLSTPP